MSNIILTADSTCDLTPELKNKYQVSYIPLHIVLGEKSYEDGVNITPPEIYQNFEATGTLPKTAAVSTGEYLEVFRPVVERGDSVIHINLGSAISSSYQNACIAAEELGNVYVVDSCNLSTGSGHIVIESAKMIEQGMDAPEIAEKLRALTKKVHSSFVIDKLDYLRAGGRCSTLAVLGANLLRIKPSIFVSNADGSMTVGKKYRGKLENVLIQYVDEQLSAYNNIRTDKIFITHAGIGEAYVKLVYDHLKSKDYFENIYITTASCTISSHCGPGTLGILFMTE
ncbi:MAG: DegV family protein [Clostridia bacterium]|nr:DegV family protein [Clostridia bacterium]